MSENFIYKTQIKCPYCGGYIEQGATKCKHCGEWIVPIEHRKPLYKTDDDVEQIVNYIEVKHNSKIGIIIAAIAFVLFIAAIFTTPSDADHRTKIKSEISNVIKETANERGSDDSFTSLIAMFLLNQDYITNTLIDKYIYIETKHCVFFSLGYVKMNFKDSLDEDNQKHLVSIGFMGQVIVIYDRETLKDYLYRYSEDNNKK